jgi:hypothetical protein
MEGSAQYAAPGFDGASWLTFADNTSAWSSAWKLRASALCVN